MTELLNTPSGRAWLQMNLRKIRNRAESPYPGWNQEQPQKVIPPVFAASKQAMTRKRQHPESESGWGSLSVSAATVLGAAALLARYAAHRQAPETVATSPGVILPPARRAETTEPVLAEALLPAATATAVDTQDPKAVYRHFLEHLAH